MQEARKPWETSSTPQHDSSTANPDPTMPIEDGAGQPCKKVASSSKTDGLSGSHLFMIISADQLNLSPRVCITGYLDVSMKRKGRT